jgi:hypothetical protein
LRYPRRKSSLIQDEFNQSTGEERYIMKNRKWVRARRIAVMVAAFGATMVSMPGPTYASVDTATVRGNVNAGAGAKEGVEVTAVNLEQGRSYKTTTRADGSYVLTGLAPGNYEIRVASGGKTETIAVHVGEDVSVDLSVAADVPDKIVIVGSAQRANVKTSEVSTVVSPEQMQNLPQVTRNFLSFADLAPGVRVNVSQANGQVSMQSGAQNQDNVNAFIDGVSQKNYILRNGITGMDSSRGNPFPQSAIAEYRVISQNYKAEYDQVSSAAINAVTKVGGNDLHGDVFWDHTTTEWSAISPYERSDRPNVKQDQYGFSLGGPIKRDAAHFFVAYEEKDINTPRSFQVQRQDFLTQHNLTNTPTVASLLAQQGSTTDKFTENLLLVKADAQLNESNRLIITSRIRRESDLVPEDTTKSTPGNQKDRKNDETRFDVKHELDLGDWFNEARFGYEDAPWNPHARSSTPMIRYIVSPTNAQNNSYEIAYTGGSPDAQYRNQKGKTIQDDLTYTGKADHTIKTGVSLKVLTFDMSGTSRAVDVLTELIDNTSGAVTVVQTDPAISPASANFKNRMFGTYVQDDWEVDKHLELNLGVRWDYEDNMLNNDYATPADRIAMLNALDSRRLTNDPTTGLPNIPPVLFPGQTVNQTYTQSLAKGGVNINDYISNGSSRKPFKGAVQPRLGFSYDLKGDKESVAFAGWGRAYDRKVANAALDELQQNAQSYGSTFLIKNDFKMPYTDQLSLGFRQRLGAWNSEIGYTNSRSHNQFTWSNGNRDPSGGFMKTDGSLQSPIDPLWNSNCVVVAGLTQPRCYGNLVLGDFNTEAKTQTVYLKADKPYTKESGWGVTVAYTLSDAKTTNKEWTNNDYNWTASKPGAGWFPSVDVERHRLVATGLTDSWLPYGTMLSGKLTLGSGLPYQITDCTAGWSHCVFHEGKSSAFRQFDIGISQNIPTSIGKIVLRGDILNVFNTTNYGSYDGWVGPSHTPPLNSFGGDNSHFGQANNISGPMRTVKLTLRYAF